MKHDDISEELYYQALLKKNFKKIMATTAFIVAIALAYEINLYSIAKKQEAAQILFEKQQAEPNKNNVLVLKKEHPSSIHTHLVLLQEAHREFKQGLMNQANDSLSFIISNSQDTGISDIAKMRLAAIQRHLGNYEKSQTILSSLTHTSALSALQKALSLPNNSKEREKALENASKKTENEHIKQLINIAQYDNIEII